MPTVSVITAAYNAERFIGETIQSVLSQTFTDFEYIIVDDGSTDNTAQIIKSFPKVEYIYQVNQGVAAARNTALALASGKYIAVLDADDVWLPEKLFCQVEELSRHQSAGLCYTNASTIYENGAIKEPRRIVSHTPVTYQSALTRYHPIITSSVLIDKKFLSPYPYNVELNCCEDFFVNLMVLYLSGPGIFIDKVLLYYREHSDSLSRKDLYYWMSQNEKTVTYFIESANAIRELPRGLSRRAIGHLALQRAQLMIKMNDDVNKSIAHLLKALVMNPSDAWGVLRQFCKLMITRYSFFISGK